MNRQERRKMLKNKSYKKILKETTKKSMDKLIEALQKKWNEEKGGTY